jgi:hypothetical protein
VSALILVIVWLAVVAIGLSSDDGLAYAIFLMWVGLAAISIAMPLLGFYR